MISKPTSPRHPGRLHLTPTCFRGHLHDRHALSHMHKASLLSCSDSLSTPEWCDYRCHLPEGEWKNYAGGCDLADSCRMLRTEVPV